MIKLKTRIIKEEDFLYNKYEEINEMKLDLWTQLRLSFVATQQEGNVQYKILDGIRYDIKKFYQ